MNHPSSAQQQAPGGPYLDGQRDEPGLVDVIRFIYSRRVKFAFHTLAVFGIGTLVFLYFFFTSPKTVEGILGLSFRGIEKSEYPSGKRFTVEDFRSPGVLTKALGDAGISLERVSLRDLAAHVYITPVIPGEIQNRWKKQEQAGQKKEEYAPSEFKIAIQLKGLTDQERIRLFDALVSRYQESVKYDQKSAKGFVYSADTDYRKLAAAYDYWDIPDLFRETYNSVTEKLNSLITESMQYQDATYQLSFREVAKDLDTWERTRLQALEALTYQGKLIRNRDLVAQRIQYRIQDLEIQTKQKSEAANEAVHLLQAIDRPKELLAGQLGAKEGFSVVDVGALDKLLKSDYVGPVVERISKLQEEIQAKQQEKSRLEKQLLWLPKSSVVVPDTIPSGYQELTTTLSRELNGIIQKYDRLLEDYLKATITSLVVVKQTPLVSRDAYSPILILPAIAFLSIFLAIVLLGIEHLFQKARSEEKRDGVAVKQRSAHSS